jgi:asparagine synthase (glutamine-hydrolysing)
MCGIAAIFAYTDNAPLVEREELLRIREAMVKRGPDGAGLWLSDDGRIGLAHRRLAIIDVSDAGAQPMHTADGTIHIVFNGEIYNYRELRGRLEAKGYEFRSKSDTEVLLHLYREYGPDLVEHLRGMYSFALYDSRKRGLLLARDPYGIKPLYYADDGATIRVASQVKSLLKSGQIDKSPEAAGHVGFFLWGHVPEPYTLFRGIRALPPGTTLWVGQQGQKQARQFFSLTDEFAKASQVPTVNLSTGEKHERLRTALLDTVRHHLVADVPVGLFLSSGIDSCMLTALATEVCNTDLRTITLGFKEFQDTPSDEVPLAEKVAKLYGTQHYTAWVTKRDFQDERDAILDVMDQPSVDGVNTYFVSKAAAEAGLKVAISGIGGDELFGGYPSFHQVPRLVSSISQFHGLPFLGKGLRHLSAPILKHFKSPKYAGLFEYGGTYGGAYLLRRGMLMPWELRKHLDGDMIREGWKELQTLSCLNETTAGIKNSHLKVSALESSWYMRNQLLRDADWASMAHSVEVRTPLVDWHMLQIVTPLLATQSRPSKKELARIPSISLPEQIIVRKKSGFAVPVREWLLKATEAEDRGLRGWAKVVHRKHSNAKRAMVLVTDAYGGFGGIAKFNRDFLASCAAHPQYREVVALPRLTSEVVSEELPERLRYIHKAAKGKLRYLGALLSILMTNRRFHVVVCGHINLLPLAWLASRMASAPLVLIVHGIEAWQPTKRQVVNRLAGKIDGLISVSVTTKDRFYSWASVRQKPSFILPNAVDMDRFPPRPKKQDLLDRHQLHGKTVIMTLGRLDSREAYKGVDEVLEVLPRVLESIPNLVYLIVGGGSDLPRLKEKAGQLGLVRNVVFTGSIPESEKADYYNLADAFVMPGRGEGFGIVYLEAMACGVPVVGSVRDGSREALLDGEIGLLVDPVDPADLQRGIREALTRTKAIPGGLEHFSLSNFHWRAKDILNKADLPFSSVPAVNG